MFCKDQRYLSATGEGNSKIAIIVSHICYFEESSDGGTWIYLTDGYSVHVKNPIEDILTRYTQLIAGGRIPV